MRLFPLLLTSAALTMSPFDHTHEATKQLTRHTGDEIQRIIDNSPPGSLIQIEGGYKILKTLLLNKHGQILQGRGEETVLTLDDGVNAPVLVVTADGVTVRDLCINGNKDKQTQERSSNPEDQTWYTCNNGITARACRKLTIENTFIRECRSAGFCSEKGVTDLRIKNMHTVNNHFDGFTGYETTGSIIDSLTSTGNQAAGISVDWYYNNNKFINPKVHSNRTGLYARAVNGLTVHGGRIENGGEVSRNIEIGGDSGHSSGVVFDGTEFGAEKIDIKDGSGVIISQATLESSSLPPRIADTSR